MKSRAFNLCLSLCIATLAGILILAAFPLLNGCSHGSGTDRALDKLSGKFITSVSRFNKKIMIAPLVNQTALDTPQTSTLFNRNLNSRLLDSCPSLLSTGENDPHASEVLAGIPKLPSGRMDNLSLAQAGRQLGLNAIAITTLSNIYREEVSTGAWLFVSLERSLHVTINVKIYDTETGTKILDDYFSRKTKVKKAVYDSMGAEMADPPMNIIQEAVIFLAREAAEEICYQMEDQPFKTYVESIDGPKITIRAGKAAGIRKGVILSIFGTGEIMNGQDGHRFYIPSLKTGAVQISDVQPNRSEGSLVSGRIDGMDACLKPQDD